MYGKCSVSYLCVCVGGTIQYSLIFYRSMLTVQSMKRKR